MLCSMFIHILIYYIFIFRYKDASERFIYANTMWSYDQVFPEILSTFYKTLFHGIESKFYWSDHKFIDPINVLLIRSKFCETNQVLEDSIKILCNPDKVLWIHIKVLVDSIKKFEILSKLHGIFWESIKVLRESFFWIPLKFYIWYSTKSYEILSKLCQFIVFVELIDIFI